MQCITEINAQLYQDCIVNSKFRFGIDQNYRVIRSTGGTFPWVGLIDNDIPKAYEF